MLPREWRKSQKLSLEQVGRMIGLQGPNPSAVYRRWELGLSKCPLHVVVEIDALSSGRVTIHDWLTFRINRPLTEAAE